MRKLIILAIVTFLGTTSSYGQIKSQKSQPFNYSNQYGLGITLGSTDGISGYFRSSSYDFFQATLAFSVHNSFYFSADTCASHPNAIKDTSSLVPYYCIGGLFFQSDSDQNSRPYSRYLPDSDEEVFLGIHIPLGIQFFIPRTPVQLGAEIAPGLLVYPATHVFWQLQLYARYLF